MLVFKTSEVTWFRDKPEYCAVIIRCPVSTYDEITVNHGIIMY